ncbi:unnamed protein product [Lampetra fluviatilis]
MTQESQDDFGKSVFTRPGSPAGRRCPHSAPTPTRNPLPSPPPFRALPLGARESPLVSDVPCRCRLDGARIPPHSPNASRGASGGRKCAQRLWRSEGSRVQILLRAGLAQP